MRHGTGRAALAAALVMLAGCKDGAAAGGTAADAAAMAVVPVTVAGPGGRHVFQAEMARTAAQQERGLMYRTGMKPDQAMLFAPYPPEGGPPRAASFWMKNTPTPLDIIFIRADGTIARIAENAVPFSEALIPSGEPIAAVLEVIGGRAADLGMAEGDKVSWPGK